MASIVRLALQSALTNPSLPCSPNPRPSAMGFKLLAWCTLCATGLHFSNTAVDGMRRRSVGFSLLGAVVIPSRLNARPEGVDRPELLPPKRADGSTPSVIDAGVGFLTKGEIKRLETLIADLEKTTGFKVRVLCQRYPETPGLAIRDYWGIDEKTVVLVADKGLKGTSNILNFNVGDAYADTLPNIFWQRLQGRYGTSRYWREKGEDVSIMNAVESIIYCAQSGCVDPPREDVLSPKLGL